MKESKYKAHFCFLQRVREEVTDEQQLIIALADLELLILLSEVSQARLY